MCHRRRRQHARLAYWKPNEACAPPCVRLGAFDDRFSQRVRRNDKDGLWHATPSPPPPPPIMPTPQTPRRLTANGRPLPGAGGASRAKAAVAAASRKLACGAPVSDQQQQEEQPKGVADMEASSGQELPAPTNAAGVAASISASLVMVSFDIPHLVRVVAALEAGEVRLVHPVGLRAGAGRCGRDTVTKTLSPSMAQAYLLRVARSSKRASCRSIHWAEGDSVCLCCAV